MNRSPLFPTPALTRPAPSNRGWAPEVSATATGSFKMGRGARIATVDVRMDGIVVSCLVRGRRVAMPTLRGESAVRFTNPKHEAHVLRAAVEAARNAERRGWLS